MKIESYGSTYNDTTSLKDYFDVTITPEEVERIKKFRSSQQEAEPGKFDIYRPAMVFERLFLQGVDTTNGLVRIAELIRKGMNMDDGTAISRARFLSYIHKIVGTSQVSDYQDQVEAMTDLEIEEKLPYLKCMNIVDHVWGTASPWLCGLVVEYDIYAIKVFNEYFFKALIAKYMGSFEIPIETVEYFVRRTFDYIIHTNILDHLPRNEVGEIEDDPSLDQAKCIELFVNHRLNKVQRISDLDNTEEFVKSVVLLKEDLPHNTVEYKINLVVQTTIWYLFRNIELKKLLRFKSEPVTLEALLDCYTETLFEENLKYHKEPENLEG